jgi:Ni/Co efflux regulator RcnB
MHQLVTRRSEMKMLVTKMVLATSVALATLIAAEAASAQDNRAATDAYDQARYLDRGTAIDSQATGEQGGTGPRVRVQPNDVVTNGRDIGRDPDPFIRDQLLREYNSGKPD